MIVYVSTFNNEPTVNSWIHTSKTKAKHAVKEAVKMSAKMKQQDNDRLAKQRGYAVSFDAESTYAGFVPEGYKPIWGSSTYSTIRNRNRSVACEGVVFEVTCSGGKQGLVAFANSLFHQGIFKDLTV